MKTQSPDQHSPDSINTTPDSLQTEDITPKTRKIASQKLTEGLTALALTGIVIGAGFSSINNPKKVFTSAESKTLENVLPKTALKDIKDAEEKYNAAIKLALLNKQKALAIGKDIPHLTEHNPISSAADDEFETEERQAKDEFSNSLREVGANYIFEFTAEFPGRESGKVIVKYKKGY